MTMQVMTMQVMTIEIVLQIILGPAQLSKQPRAKRVAFIRPLKGGRIKEKAAVMQQRLA
jgi:hypothetical protein